MTFDPRPLADTLDAAEDERAVSVVEAPTPEEVVQQLSGADLAEMRRMCQVDLFFLANAVLGYTQVTESTHAALCQFIVKEPSNRRMVLMPRGFLKTTICTISDSIRLALCDPNTRILIANEVEENAIGFLKELKAHWVGDDLLPLLFPELVPARLAGPGSDWAQGASSVQRTGKSKESTWTAIGVGGTKVSQHYKKIKCDDLVGARAKDSPAEMTRTTRWTEDMTGLLDSLSDGIDLYGTRKLVGDTYAILQERWKTKLQCFIREPFNAKGESIFPKMTTDELMAVMIDTPDVWAADYMNNPVGKGGTDWGTGYVQYFTITDTLHGARLRFIDPVSGKPKSWLLAELDVVITADPNSGKPLAPDKAAIVVHGVSPDDEIFVLSSRSDRWSPDGLVEEIFKDAERWHPRVVGIEEAGQQNTIYHFEKKCSKERMFYRIEALKHKNVKKDVRIRTALDTPLKSKRMFFQRTQLQLVSQVQLHPQLAEHNWDEIDALAYGTQIYRAGTRQEDNEAREEAKKNILLLRGVTGYGNTVSRRGPR